MNRTNKPQGPRIVTRQCSDQDQANAAYLKLCDQYDSVQLLRAPFFGSGTYAWTVTNQTAPRP